MENHLEKGNYQLTNEYIKKKKEKKEGNFLVFLVPINILGFII